MNPPKDLNLTFSGCGFLGIYHLGVVSCLKDNAPDFLKRVKCFGGTSAGAFAATALLMDLNVPESAEFVLRLAKRAQSLTLGPLHPNFRIVNTVKKSFERILPDNAHEIATNRLHISLTRVSDFKNVIVSEFTSKEDLIEALLASSHVPFYSSILPAKFRGVYYVDGGLTDNLLQHFTGETITVSPFSGESDICPRDGSANFAHVEVKNTSVQFTLQNLYRCSRAFFPPEVEVLCEMCKQGYRDTLRFLQTQYPETLSTDARRKPSLSVFMPSGLNFTRWDDPASSALSKLDSVPTPTKSCSTSSMSAYSTCSDGGTEVLAISEGDQDDEGESRLSALLDRTHEAIIEAELWSCYFIRKACWVFMLAAQPCVLSVKQITHITHVVLESLPVIEKTGIEFMDHLLSMIYVVVHTYKDKHMVHDRKLVAITTGQQQKLPNSATISQASIELVQRWKTGSSCQPTNVRRLSGDEDFLLESDNPCSENSDIEVILDESFSSNVSGYDMCHHLSFLPSKTRKFISSHDEQDMDLGQWESEGGACHAVNPKSLSVCTSEEYIVLEGYETDVESMSSDNGEEFASSFESNV